MNRDWNWPPQKRLLYVPKKPAIAASSLLRRPTSNSSLMRLLHKAMNGHRLEPLKRLRAPRNRVIQKITPEHTMTSSALTELLSYTQEHADRKSVV